MDTDGSNSGTDGRETTLPPRVQQGKLELRGVPTWPAPVRGAIKAVGMRVTCTTRWCKQAENLWRLPTVAFGSEGLIHPAVSSLFSLYCHMKAFNCPWLYACLFSFSSCVLGLDARSQKRIVSFSYRLLSMTLLFRCRAFLPMQEPYIPCIGYKNVDVTTSPATFNIY